MVPAEAVEAAVDAELARTAPELLAAINESFAGAVLLVARALGGCPDATSARATAIDSRGIEAVVDGDGDARRTRIEFAAPLTSADELSATLLDLVAAAQAASGERLDEWAGLRTFVTSVVAVEDLHPHLRRITVTGGDLATYVPAGPDTFLYVLLPPEGRDQLTVDQSFTWTGYQQLPEADRPVGAYYTQRAWRPDTLELDLLLVLHGETGPASRWALRARPGDPLALWGPRTAWAPPADTTSYLLVADDTGLPAAAAVLESLPADALVHLIAEVDDEAERHPLPALGPSTTVTWCYRRGAAPGTTTLLADAVRAHGLPGGTPYVWGGGESRAMTAVRKHVRDGSGLERERVSLVAYWRHADHATDPPDAD